MTKYRYKLNQPERTEVDGPLKGRTWTPGKTYNAGEVPKDKIGTWFEKVDGAKNPVTTSAFGSAGKGLPADPVDETSKKDAGPATDSGSKKIDV